MRICRLLLCSFLLNVLVAPLSLAQNAQEGTFDFDISEGSVTTTPSFCHPSACQSVTARLSGTFTATFSQGTVTFANINVRTEPDSGFSLPEQPDTDSNGTSRSIKYTFDGVQLSVSGIVDSRAFDGPLHEYEFVATTQDGIGFDPKGFFTARPDYRRCAFPMCGGFFVKEVNKRVTQCADGEWRSECYVAEIDWEEIGFNPQSGAYSASPDLLQGRIDNRIYPGNVYFGVFRAKAAYQAATTNPPEGTFVGLESEGFVCITSPCFSIREYVLNWNKINTISGFDLNAVGATNDQVEQAYQIFGDGGVLIAAGKNQKVEEMHGTGVTFFANQFYLPIRSTDSTH